MKLYSDIVHAPETIMTVVRGRPIHFDLTEKSREIFKSIIISRYSVRDKNDEVLRTDDGLAYIKQGKTNWKLTLSETEVLVPSTAQATEPGSFSEKPELVAVKATWYSPTTARKARVNIKAGGNANVFYGLGAIFVPDDFRIPIVQASRENVRHYGLTLIENQHALELLSDEFDLVLAKYHYAKNYSRDFLTEAEGGGGYFVETHNFPHIHVPLIPDCGGFIIIGKKLSENYFNFTAFSIPYGYALHTPANTIHGDGTIVGEYAITVATASADADTVLFYNEHSRATAREVFPKT
jgi:hypothetical protein